MALKSEEAKQRKLKWKKEYHKRPETKIKEKGYACKYQKSGKRAAAQQRRRHNNPWHYWARNACHNHIMSGYVVTINILDLEQMALATIKCPICDKVLNWHNDKLEDDSPSLDRIYNGIDVNMNTIQIICVQCNSTKQSRTMMEFIKYCHMVSSKFPQPGVSKG